MFVVTVFKVYLKANFLYKYIIILSIVFINNLTFFSIHQMENNEKAEYAEMSNQRPSSQQSNPTHHLVGQPAQMPGPKAPENLVGTPPMDNGPPPHVPVPGPEQHQQPPYAPPPQPHPQGYPVQHGYPQGPPQQQGYPPHGYPYGPQGGPPPHQGYPGYPPYHHPGPYHEPYMGGPPPMPHGSMPPPPGAVPAPPGPHPGVPAELAMPPGKKINGHLINCQFNII